jgi:hypothetical protein
MSRVVQTREATRKRESLEVNVSIRLLRDRLGSLRARSPSVLPVFEVIVSIAGELA